MFILDYVNCLLHLSDGRLASCLDDKTKKIYNQSNYKCELTLYGHKKGVNYISEIISGKIVSSSNDLTIKI